MPPSCKAIEALVKNTSDVDRLLEIHKDVTGTQRGRRRGVEVLNKSGVVLLTAAWEAFVEDLAQEAFDFLLKHAKSSDLIPPKVRTLASKRLKDAADGIKVWQLAGPGWRKVLLSHKARLMERHIGTFNTPKPNNIDSLFQGLIGLRHLSSKWTWQAMSVSRARANLIEFVEHRGAIAHRVKPKRGTTKAYVSGHKTFIYRLAVKSTNTVRSHLTSLVGRTPWQLYQIGRTR